MGSILRVLVILPAYNEEGKIGRVVEKIKAAGGADGIVAVDDCSSDKTSLEAEKAGAIVIRHSLNRGVGAGIRTGIMYGIENKYDIGVVMSGDDQHEPKELARTVAPILNDEFDFIQGSRRMKGGQVVNDRPFRMIMTQLYSLFFTILVRRRITDATNGFRAFRFSIFEDKNINISQDWLDRYELEPYLLYKVVKKRSIRFKEMPITIYYHEGRRQFTKMKPFLDWWRLAKPMIYLALGLRK
jgi:dolichol-phosphate mannosyltransferase